jgi:hypothetical protein
MNSLKSGTFTFCASQGGTTPRRVETVTVECLFATGVAAFDAASVGIGEPTKDKGKPTKDARFSFPYDGKNSSHPAAKSCVIKMPIKGERLGDA